MPDKTIIDTKTIFCSKCDHDITFRYKEKHFYANELIQPIAKVFDGAISYGECKVAADAKVQNHPIHDELQKCPAYQELSSK